MAKSTIVLPDGTKITIDGAPEEIKKIISVYSSKKEEILAKTVKREEKKEITNKSSEDVLLNIINFIKECDEADAIEKNILDRSSQIDRVLLPLYVAGQLKDKPSLTSGDIYGVLKELGIKIATPNISNTLRKGASKYVMADRRVKRGQAAGYRLSRSGNQYLSKVLIDSKND